MAIKYNACAKQILDQCPSLKRAGSRFMIRYFTAEQELLTTNSKPEKTHIHQSENPTSSTKSLFMSN